jgi:hypothetical protein
MPHFPNKPNGIQLNKYLIKVTIRIIESSWETFKNYKLLDNLKPVNNKSFREDEMNREQENNSCILYHFPQKWKSLVFGWMLFLVACSINPGSKIEPTIVPIAPFQDSSYLEQDEFTNYLPILITSQNVNSCTESSFGTMLVNGNPGDWITPAEVLIYANDQLGIKGMAATGAPSEDVRDDWFGKLPGWTNSFIRGTYDQLIPIHATATHFNMQDMYACIGYGPESAHQAGDEALDPLSWVPMAEAVADDTGKCLIYGPAVLDYERLATPIGESETDAIILAELIAGVSPHIDIWMIQLAQYQRWTDAERDDTGNPYSMQDFINWLTWWVTQIKTANPSAKVWTQLGIGKYDPIQKVCLPPQPPEYILDYREGLIKAGVDGLFIMPSQPCQMSDDPQDREYYLQSLFTIQTALDIACGQ